MFGCGSRGCGNDEPYSGVPARASVDLPASKQTTVDGWIRVINNELTLHIPREVMTLGQYENYYNQGRTKKNIVSPNFRNIGHVIYWYIFQDLDVPVTKSLNSRVTRVKALKFEVTTAAKLYGFNDHDGTAVSLSPFDYALALGRKNIVNVFLEKGFVYDLGALKVLMQFKQESCLPNYSGGTAKEKLESSAVQDLMILAYKRKFKAGFSFLLENYSDVLGAEQENWRLVFQYINDNYQEEGSDAWFVKALLIAGLSAPYKVGFDFGGSIKQGVREAVVWIRGRHFYNNLQALTDPDLRSITAFQQYVFSLLRIEERRLAKQDMAEGDWIEPGDAELDKSPEACFTRLEKLYAEWFTHPYMAKYDSTGLLNTSNKYSSAQIEFLTSLYHMAITLSDDYVVETLSFMQSVSEHEAKGFTYEDDAILAQIRIS